MSAERWRRLREIYDAVIDAPAADRPRLVDELCGDDAGLRADVEAVLDADSASHSWLDDSLVAFVTGAFKAGDVLCDRFELLRLAGKGGMGEVWAAHDRTEDKDVAVKTIASSFMTGPEAVSRFTREVQLALRVAHPNVCRVHALFEDRSGPAPRLFLTMELLDGQTLAALLAKDGRLPADRALWIFGQLLDGLAVAHAAGVVHRDLKPGNIMIVPGVTSPRVVIMDFGLARTSAPGQASTAASNTQAPVGTPEYMAPEQLSGREVSPATDIYALGVILFEMLAGAPPFRSASTLESIMRRAREAPRKLAGEVAGVTRAIDAAIAKALAFEPQGRFTSVEALRAAVGARGQSRASIPLPSRRVGLAVGAVAVVLVVAASAGFFWMRPAIAAPSPEALRKLDAAHQSLAEGANVRARSDAEQAVKAAPSYAPAHAVLAEALLELETPGRASQAMLNADVDATERSALPPHEQDYVAGVRALLVRDCDRAMRHFEARSAMASPDRPVRLMTTARAYERCDRVDDADRALKAAAELDARNPAVPLRRGRLLGRARRVDDAMAAFALAESLFLERNNLEGVAEVASSRGAVEALENRLDEADVTLARGAELARTLGDIRQQIRVALWQAVVRRKQNRLSEAIALTTQAIELANRNDLEGMALDGLFAAGNAHLGRNQNEEARAVFARALAIADANRHDALRARGRLSLATAYVRLLDPDKTIQAVEDARPYYRRIRHANNLLIADTLEGQARLMRGEFTAGIDLFLKALASARDRKAQADEATAQENLGTAFTGAGRMREAVAAYQAAARLREATKEPRRVFYARLNAADLLSRLGAHEEAQNALPALTDARDSGRKPEPELEARYRLVVAGQLFRRGLIPRALSEAERGYALTAGMRERRTGIALVSCVIAAHAASHAIAAARCQEAESVIAPSAHTMLKLELALTKAEAALARRDTVVARAQLDDAVRLIGSEANQLRWRLLALRAAVNRLEQRSAGPDRDALSRELQRLRLEWGGRDFTHWRQRADVGWLLKASGMRDEEVVAGHRPAETYVPSAHTLVHHAS